MTAPRRALVVGRFQPFHNGHLEALRRLAPAWDELIVAVGSADASHTPKNPFTAGERIEMIHAALREAGIANALVVPVPDLNRNPLWVAHVRSLVPRFATFYSNNPLPARLFREAGVDVRPLPFVSRDEFEGTTIRRLMIEGDDAWAKRVPPAVARLVRDLGGPERLRDLAEEDRRAAR